MLRNRIFTLIVFCIFALSVFFIYSCKHDVLYPEDYGYNQQLLMKKSTTPNPNPDPNPNPNPNPDTNKLPKDTCDPNVVYFESQILPIFISNCSMCHNVSSSGENKLNLTTYAGIISAGVKKIQESLKPGEDVMPPVTKTPLTQTQKDLIDKWIAQGALNINCSNCDTTSVTYTKSIEPVITAYCLGCHSGSGTLLKTYDDVKNNTRLWGAINQSYGYMAMPQNGSKLSACDLAKFKIWIKNNFPK